MAIYALDDADDALDATREFLAPIDPTVWAKLALVMVFVGGFGAGIPSLQFTPNTGTPGEFPGTTLPTLGPNSWAVVAVVVALVVLVGLAFALVRAVMEFVLVESLRTETVTLGRYWSGRWRQGVRLFGFRLVLGVLVLVVVLLLLAPVLVSPSVTAEPRGLSLALFLTLVPLFAVVVAVVGLVNGFTTVFVVPIMVLEDCGVLAGWRRLWSSVVDAWKQYLAYAVAGFVLGLLAGVVSMVVTLAVAFVLLVPFGVLFALGVGLYFLVPSLGVAALVVVGVVFALALLVVFAVVQVPIQTYLRYYALFVLGDVEPDFDLIADLRARVRAPESNGVA